jgi:transcriptional regulator with XRE-family HTH domain
MAMDMRKLVGANFKRLRDRKELSQEDVAERSGFSQQYICALEKGQRNPTIISLFEIAQAVGVSHIELVMPLSAEEIDKIIQEKSKVSSRRKHKGLRVISARKTS